MLRTLFRVVGVSAFSVIASFGAAAAADMAVKAPPAPLWSWSGYYIGVNAGYGWNSLSGQTSCATCVILPPADLDPAGGLFGGQVGYNVQSGRLVYGVEADFQGANIKDSATFPNGVLINVPTFAGNLTASQRLDWFGTARARVG